VNVSGSPVKAFPMRRHFFIGILLTVVLVDVLPGHAQNHNADVSLTLSSQTPWQGPFGWCAFTADIHNDKGNLSNRCGAGPFGSVMVPTPSGTER
jgi:hypothetical protein